MTLAVRDPRAHLEACRLEVAADPASSRGHFRLGTALVQLGHAKQGEAELRRALELDPSCAPALVNLGGVLLARWDFHGCVEANRHAAALDPGLTLAHYNQGLGHLYLGQAAETADCFRRVLELDPQNAGAHYHLAVGLLALGDKAASREHLDAAVKLGFTPQPEFVRQFERLAEDEASNSEIGR